MNAIAQNDWPFSSSSSLPKSSSFGKERELVYTETSSPIFCSHDEVYEIGKLRHSFFSHCSPWESMKNFAQRLKQYSCSADLCVVASTISKYVCRRIGFHGLKGFCFGVMDLSTFALRL